jgi:pyridoxal biosynthesis lyase PdxS
MDEKKTGTLTLKTGLAEMLKGGVIMDVTTAEQAKIAEDAGAVSVMALERVPSDIRKDGGVARMADPEVITRIMDVVSIPVMAKCRIGHFAEARVLEALGVDYIDESEVLTPSPSRCRSSAGAATSARGCAGSARERRSSEPRARRARATWWRRCATCGASCRGSAG